MSVYSKNKKIYCKDTGEIATGESYLMTKHWQMLRQKIYQKYKGECQRCKTVVPINLCNIHHRTYKRIGHEHENDLVLYCKNCHTTIHKNKKEWHSTNKDIQFYIKQLTDNEKKKVINYIKTYIICQ